MSRATRLYQRWIKFEVPIMRAWETAGFYVATAIGALWAAVLSMCMWTDKDPDDFTD